MRIAILLSIIFLFNFEALKATHNRAGEIRYQQINELTIRAEIFTYTKSSSVAADRDTLVIMWGDGTLSSIPRQNGKGVELPNDIKVNIYEIEHTYPGRGEYVLTMLDPNRIENILNVDPPNSVNIPFFIQTKIKLFNTNFQGINQSPILTNPPIDIACLNQLFIHNPGAIDLDGDSLSFELVIPLMDLNTPVPNYVFPNQIRPGLNNSISMDSRNGNFMWNAPQLAGEYNIAIAIHEFRNGQLISTTIRDMQILVRADCSNNNPPTISGRKDTCILAGTQLNLNFTIDDIDKGLKGGMIKVQAYGAPFIIDPIATTNSSLKFDNPPYQFNIQWNTSCKHVRTDYYSIIIKATDNYYDTSGLSNTFIYRIKVIGPPPQNLTTQATSKNIELNWENPYYCDTSMNSFRGFSVWRKETSIKVNDTCITGLDKYGYLPVDFLSKNILGNKYFFLDTTVQRNRIYCYRVQAEFALETAANFLYNFTPSLPSNESCNSLTTNEPLLLNVDVIKTAQNNGEIFIKYNRPIVPLFDTLAILPPYQIKVFYSTQLSNFQEILAFNRTFNSYNTINDTSFLHDQLNTELNKHEYYIGLESSNSESLKSETAEQVFLSTSNFKKGIKLDWTANTPWLNDKYIIYRKNNLTTTFDSIGLTDKLNFTDQFITQDSMYCYFVKSFGQYSNPNIVRPLINNSNISCITAFDSTPPCCPVLQVFGPCELGDTTEQILLSWSFNEDSCNSKDIEQFTILERNGDVIKQIPGINKNIRQYRLNAINNINSCFSLYAINSKKIKCLTEEQCITQCPNYILPNTFTPNSDGFNDIYKPILNRQILKVDFKVINNWGNEVFRTSDPNLNWDGTNLNGNVLNDGTYYYSCTIFPFSNTPSMTITGFIELLKGK